MKKQSDFLNFCIIIMTLASVMICVLGKNAYINPKSLYQTTMVVILVVETIIAFIGGKLFFPRFIYSFILLFTGLVGGANLVVRGAYVDFFNEYYHLIFYASINVGYFILQKHFTEQYENYEKIYSYKHKIIYVIIVIGIVALFINWVLLGGIPLLHGEVLRFGSKPTLSSLFNLGAVASVFLFVNGKKKIFYFVFVLSILTGYRSGPVLLLLLVLFYFLFFSKMKFSNKIRLIIVGAIFFGAINIIKYYRDIDFYGMSRYVEIAQEEGLDMPLVFSPIVHTLVEGPSIFQQVRENLNNNYGYGVYYLETLATVLPGQQRSYGDIYNDITNAPTSNTKTGTVLGAIYIDGGIVLIIATGLVLGIFTKEFFRKALLTNNLIYKFLFTYYFTSMILWIHSGLFFPPVFMIVFIVFFVFAKKARIISKKQGSQNSENSIV